MLKFGQDVRFMLLVMIEKISDLHLCGKLVSCMWETSVATCQGYIAQVPGAPFILCN